MKLFWGEQFKTSKSVGDAAEQQALVYLQQQGLQLVQRNYKTPGRGGGEIDLIMRHSDGTLVFVEVRKRNRDDYGGALASVSAAKQQRIVRAAKHFLLRLDAPPACRFDVVWVHDQLHWLQGAFFADVS